LVKKELFIDHVNWEKGKDYDLGVSVAKEFKAAGFEDASADGTPFVVISDLYAVAGYSTDLEKTIDEAYEAGDKDIVTCISKGNKDCLKHLKEDTKDSSSSSEVSGESLLVIITCAVVLLIVYIVKSNADKKEILQALETLVDDIKK
jgi:hypothetical protein